MRIAQISKADEFGGGASRVASDLTRLFNRSPDTSKHYVSWAGHGYSEDTLPFYGSHERVIRGLHLVQKLAGFPELLPFEILPEWKSKRLIDFDILHFHDLSSAISPLTLGILGRRQPVVWTIHDASPFTGGCLYPFECEKFKKNCGGCPQLGEWPIDIKVDTTRLLLSIKRKVHQTQKVKMITPSKWMSDLAFSSGTFDSKPEIVPNGVDIDLFMDSGKDEAKKSLGVPLERNTVLLSAGNVLDERKGSRFALEAIRAVPNLRLFVLIVGSPSAELSEKLTGIDHKILGYLSEPTDIARAYRAADIHLFCSLADNQPLSVLETMSSGTPTVGFATGGVPEMVKNDVSGLLVEAKDIRALVQAVERAFSEKRYRAWAFAARKTVESSFTLEQVKKAHQLIYADLLK